MAVKSVLVPVDGGAASFAALNQACVIAKRFGAHIMALHAMQRVSDGAPVGLYNLSADMRKDIEQKVEAAELDKSKELQAQFEDLCKKCDIAITDRPTDKDGATSPPGTQEGHHSTEQTGGEHRGGPAFHRASGVVGAAGLRCEGMRQDRHRLERECGGQPRAGDDPAVAFGHGIGHDHDFEEARGSRQSAGRLPELARRHV
ncbi:MAG: universal stress protein [Gammaproteobacteria bacterium]